MEYIDRGKSTITGKANLESLYVLKDFPVFIGCTDRPRKEDLHADMSFAMCKDTGIIQLDKVLPADIVYSEYHSEALGGVWEEHHKQFADFIHANKPTDILEIGGSNGVLAKEYFQSYGIKPWTIVEPNPSPSLRIEKNINLMERMFDSTFKFTGKVDTLVHSHTLEHMYEPREFLETIAEFLPIGARHIFSVPNLYEYLKNKQPNCLNFEHTIFLTEYMIDYLLFQYGFEIEDKKYFRNHSIMYSTKKKATPVLFSFQSQYEEYKELFLDYVQSMKAMVAEFNKRLIKHEGPIYLFGAHVFSQLFVQFGLDTRRVVAILDNSALKQDKRLYGTDLFVESPDVIRDKDNPLVILKVGAYQEEVRTQLLRINPTAIIVE